MPLHMEGLWKLHRCELFTGVKTSERGTPYCLSTALSPPGLTFAPFVKLPALGGGGGGQWALMDTEFHVYSH